MPAPTVDSSTQIEIKEEDLLNFEGDGIIVPTISDGLMVEGIAARVKAAGGPEVETEAVRCAPIAVGAAVVTTAGTLRCRHVIHVPVAEQAGLRVGVESIRRATRAGLLAATHFRLDRIAIPGMGYYDSTVPPDEAARAIIDEIRAYKNTPPLLVTLMDTEKEMLEAFLAEFGDF